MAAIHLNESQFKDIMAQGKTVLIDYWAPWCSYCRRINPAYDKVAEQHGDELIVAKVNIDEAQQLAAAEQIEVIPTLVLYREGKAIGSIVAPASKAAIDDFIREALSN